MYTCIYLRKYIIASLMVIMLILNFGSQLPLESLSLGAINIPRVTVPAYTAYYPEKTIVFDTLACWNNSTTLSVSRFAEVNSASMTITALPYTDDTGNARSSMSKSYSYPHNPTFRIGDISTCWEFPGTMGLLQEFSDGATEYTIEFLHDEMFENSSAVLQIPSSATVSSATVCLDATSSQFYKEVLFTNIDTIYSIAVDPSGTAVWYGSSGGLVKYDIINQVRVIYTVQDGLSANQVNALAIDADTIYIGTSNGICRFNKNYEQFEPEIWSTTSPAVAEFIGSDNIHTIFIDGDMVYFGTDGGVTRYNKATDNFESIWNTSTTWTTSPANSATEGITSDTIYSITGDMYYIYIGTGSGTARYNKYTGQWDRLAWHYPGDPPEPPPPHIPGMIPIRSLAVDLDVVYIGTDMGVYRYNKTIETFESRWNMSASQLVSNFVRVVYIDHERAHVYIGTTEGVSRFIKDCDTEDARWTTPQLISNWVNAIGLNANVVYFGTINGMSRLNLTSGTFATHWHTGKTGLIDNRVSAIVTDDTIVYIGTYMGTTGGVCRYNVELNRYEPAWTHETGLPSVKVSAIATDDDYVYIGTANAGVGRFNKQLDEFEPKWTTHNGLISNKITTILADENIVYIGTTEGVSRYDKTSGEFIEAWSLPTLTSDRVTSIVADTQRVYIGTKPYWNGSAFVGGGVSIYNKVSATFESHLDTTQGLPSNMVTDIAIDPYTGRVYITTYGGGVCRWTPSVGVDHVWNVTETSGLLPSDTVVATAVSAGFVYFATASGIGRLDKSSGQFIVPLTTAIGASSNDITTLFMDGYTLYIGTDNAGLDRWDELAYEYLDQSLYFSGYPHNPTLDVGADGTIDWQYEGEFDVIVTVPDFADELNTLIPTAPISYCDDYGNEFCTIHLKLTSEVESKILLKSLRVVYTYSAQVPNFAAALNTYIIRHGTETDWKYNVTVPLNFFSETPGKLKITNISIVYTLSAHPPAAKIDSPRSGITYTTGDLIYFDGRNSTDPAGKDDILYYLWRSNISGLIGSTKSFYAHLPAGDHNITLTVEDSVGNTGTTAVSILVVDTNQAPIARIDAPVAGGNYYASVPIYFDGANSTDPDGDELTYSWYSSREGLLSTEPTFSKVLNAGTHIITLIVDDGHGKCSEATVSIDVQEIVIKTFTADNWLQVTIAYTQPGTIFNLATEITTPGTYPTGYGGIGKIFQFITDYENIIWAYIEVTYTDADITGIVEPEATLRLYYWDTSTKEWRICVRTGMEPSAKLIWANVSQQKYSNLIFAVIGKLKTEAIPPLTVTHTIPARDATDVELRPRIRITFDREIILSSVSSTSLELIDAVGNQVKCTLQDPVDAKEICFVPDVELEPGTRYTATISGVQAQDGGMLDPPYSWTFTTKQLVTPGAPTKLDVISVGIIIIVVVAIVMAILIAIILIRQYKRKKAEEEERAKEEERLVTDTRARLVAMRAAPMRRLPPSPRMPVPPPSPVQPRPPPPSPPVQPPTPSPPQKVEEKREEEVVKPVRRRMR